MFREQLDISDFLERSADLLGGVREHAGLDVEGGEDSDTFTNMANRVRAMKNAWEVRSASFGNSTQNVGDQGGGTNGAGAGVELFDFQMEFSDEDWLRDLIGDGRVGDGI